MARSEEELKIFNEMDRQMGEREGKEQRLDEIKRQKPYLKDFQRVNWRLIQEWEVPDWVKVQPIDKDDEQFSMVQSGKRARKAIINYDHLSEQQFLKIVEEGRDPNEVLKMEAEKRELRRKRVGEDGMEQIDEDM